jgi:NitT/TauT family transport system ATP-binding protein
VNLEISQGELVCIVGPSGCGKSTLLNIVGGFLHHTRGQVTVEGRPVDGPIQSGFSSSRRTASFPG